MGLIASNTPSKDFELLPQGTHQAICIKIIDLGWQEVEWQGAVKNLPKVWLQWEVPGLTLKYSDKDGNEKEGPFTIGKTYTVGLGEKYTMKLDFEAWRGKAFTKQEEDGFAIKNVLGKPCQINVTHQLSQKGKEYAKVSGLAEWPKGLEVPTPANDLYYYDPDDGDFDSLPAWAQEKWAQETSSSFAEPTNDDAYGEQELDDDIPF